MCVCVCVCVLAENGDVIKEIGNQIEMWFNLEYLKNSRNLFELKNVPNNCIIHNFTRIVVS